MTKPRKPNRPIDRAAFHRTLAERVDLRGRLIIHQGDLAEELELNMFAMNRVMNEFQRDGRIRRIQNLRDNVGVYEVVDPTVWKWRLNSRLNSRDESSPSVGTT